MENSSIISGAFVNQSLLQNMFSSRTNGSFANLLPTSTSSDLAAAATQSLLGATFGYTQDNTISTLTQSLLSTESQTLSISQTAHQISELYNRVRSSNNTNAIDGMNTILSELIQNNQDPLTFINSVKTLSSADLTSVMETANAVESTQRLATGKSDINAWINQAMAAFSVSDTAGKQVVASTQKILAAQPESKLTTNQALSDYIKANQTIADLNTKADNKDAYFKQLAQIVQTSTNLHVDINSFDQTLSSKKPLA